MEDTVEILKTYYQNGQRENPYKLRKFHWILTRSPARLTNFRGNIHLNIISDQLFCIIIKIWNWTGVLSWYEWDWIIFKTIQLNILFHSHSFFWKVSFTADVLLWMHFTLNILAMTIFLLSFQFNPFFNLRSM